MTNITAAGFSPRLVVGDGADGWPDGGPYHRVHVTCAVERFPYAWVEQTRPGGVIAAPWSPDCGNGQLARLVVDADGQAVGRFPAFASYMMLRSQRRTVKWVPHHTDDANETATRIDLRAVARDSYGGGSRDRCAGAGRRPDSDPVHRRFRHVLAAARRARPPRTTAVPIASVAPTPIRQHTGTMSASPAQPVIDTHLIVRDGDKILLSQRGGPYGYGRWHMPSGKLDRGETLTSCAARELLEETGIVVDPADLNLVHVVHHHQTDEVERIGFFFEAVTWNGEPVNKEPSKCLALQWFAVHDLPEDFIEYPEAGLRGYLHSRRPLTEHGWTSGSAAAVGRLRQPWPGRQPPAERAR